MRKDYFLIEKLREGKFTEFIYPLWVIGQPVNSVTEAKEFSLGSDIYNEIDRNFDKS